MRIKSELIGLLILIAVFVVAIFFLAGQPTGSSHVVGKEEAPDPSIYNDRESGTMAFFQFVHQAGYDNQVLRQSWSTLSRSTAAVLVVAEPAIDDVAPLTGVPFGSPGVADTSSTALTAADAPLLERWVRSGHTALLLISRMSSGQIAGGTGGTDSFGDALGVFVDSTATYGEQTEFVPLQPTPLARGIVSIHCHPGVRARGKNPDFVTLFGDSEMGAMVAAVPVGKGRIIVVADGEFASNGNLSRSENAVFLGNLLARYAQPGETVLFDEYHHGDVSTSGGMALWPALGRPLQTIVLQILLAAVLAVIVAGSRFGTPVPLLRGVQRNSAEYVTSLAGLYLRAGASSTMLEMIYNQFLRDLTVRLGVSSDSNLEQLAAVASRRSGVSGAEMRRLLAACEQRIDSGVVSEVDLLDLVRRMDRIRKEIGIV
ncbi:MAG: DUF4350 domain-containing protein [Capsulimonadaceae bacterium]